MRDFTINAIALPLAGGDAVDPYGGRGDLEQKLIRAVSASAFKDDPLRLLRAVRLEDELGFRMDSETERLVARTFRARHSTRGRADSGRVGAPVGRRATGEPTSLVCWPRSAARAPGSSATGSSTGPPFGSSRSSATRCVACRFRTSSSATRGSCFVRSGPKTDRCAPIHRFRRATEPWARDALVFVGAAEHAEAVREAREQRPRRAAAPRRRARPASRPGDRPPPRARRRGTRGGRDLDARRGARARQARAANVTALDAHFRHEPDTDMCAFPDIGSQRGGGGLYRFNWSARRRVRGRVSKVPGGSPGRAPRPGTSAERRSPPGRARSRARSGRRRSPGRRRPGRSRPRRSQSCGKPSVCTKPGLTVWTWIPRGRSSLATDREKASCACFDAEYGPTATVPATETTLTRCDGAPASSAGSKPSRHQTEPR